MNHNEIKEQLMRAETVDQAADIARNAGMELTAEGAAKLFKEIQQHKMMESKPHKLDEDELNAISGGRSGTSICKGSIMSDGLTSDRTGRITELYDVDWCWSGLDYCYQWTETYDGVKINGVSF